MAFQVNGDSGRYDGKIADNSVRYGRNAVDNHFEHAFSPISDDHFETAPILDFSQSAEAKEKNIEAIEDFIEENDKYLNSLPPIEYEYRYLPNIKTGNIDKKALLAAAFEEMGGAEEISVKDFEKAYLNEFQTAEPLDINKDGKIDVAEYGANMLAADILSKGTTDPMKANGVINAKGMNAILEYTKKSNAAAAAKLYSNIYHTHQLGNALNQI